MIDHSAARAAGKAARAAYLAAVPEPNTLDFRCTRCQSVAGHPCTRRAGDIGEFHMPRQDQRIRAFNRRQVEAMDADDAGCTVHRDRAAGRSVESIARSLPKRYRGPYLLAKGWTRVSDAGAGTWRSPDGSACSMATAIRSALQDGGNW